MRFVPYWLWVIIVLGVVIVLGQALHIFTLHLAVSLTFP
jgi:hypothetical protein